jgi:Fe-S-cluster-containing hydrogenase component 2
MVEIGPREISGMLATLESHKLHIFPQQCVRSRHRKAACTLCADNCPTGAIVWSGSVRIDADKCIRCGLCAAVCPAGVFEARSPTNAELLRQIEGVAKATSTIAFACPRVAGGDRPGVVRLTCLGRLDASILIGSVAAGIQTIGLVDAECQSCPNSIGHVVAAQAISETDALLQACGVAPRIAFVDHTDLLDQPAGGTTRATSVKADSPSGKRAQAPQPPFNKGELPTRVPAKRLILLSGLRRLADQVVNPELNTTQWATVSIKATCTVCQMCAFFCPTGALVRTVEDGKPGLAFKNADCTACNLCRDICYTGSVELSASVDLNKVIADSSEVVWSNTQTSSQEEKVKRLRVLCEC